MKHFIFTIFTLFFVHMAHGAEPILVPDVTPGTTSEFGIAGQLQKVIEQGLKEKGYMVLTSQTVRPVVGGQIDGCFDEQTCPYGPLQHLPVRMALVARVVRDVERVLVQVAVYDGTSIQPVDTHELQVNGANDQNLVAAIVRMVDEAQGDLEPAPASLWEEAAALVTKSNMNKGPTPTVQSKPETAPVIVNINQNVPTPAAVADKPAPTEATASSASRLPAPRAVRYAPRHFYGVKKAFERSGMEARGWMLKKSPHSGRFLFELRSGVGIGDVDRHADVHVTITDDASLGWYQEGPLAGTRVRGAVYVGYAPTAMIDFGVAAGLQYGFKTLVSGWTDTSSSGTGESLWGSDVAQAVQFYVQPRVRAYIVWMGPVKPYALLGFETRVFDSLKIADTNIVDYPDPSGGVFFGPLVGAGLVIDPGPAVGFFAEAAFTAHVGSRSEYRQNSQELRPTGEVAEPQDFVKRTFGIVGGVQFRL